MTTWTVRLGLSLMVVIGFWTNRLPAQEVLLVPYVPYEPALQPPPSYPYHVRPLAASDKALHRAFNKHGMCCADDGYYRICAGWRYEAHFVFGSCNWFFGQPCEPSMAHEKHWRR